MACRGRKGKHHVFLRQRSAQRTCAHVVSHKDDILCRIRPQGIEDRVELRIAQDDEDHVVLVLRFQLRHDRNAADRHAGRKLILDPKAVFLDALAPCSPRQQRDVLSRAEEIPRQIAAEHARAEY